MGMTAKRIPHLRDWE